MKAWGVAFWISLGGFLECRFAGAEQHLWTWTFIMLAAALGWGWSALAAGALTVVRRFAPLVTGRPVALPRTDPQALALEMAALNAQIAQLRDTATSFDVSFDQTLQRLDERLRRVEQQSPFVHIRPGA